MMKKIAPYLVSICMLSSAPFVFAAGDHSQHDHATPEGMAEHNKVMQQDNSKQDSTMTAGEIRKIDSANSKITLRHDAMPSLNMPTPMTMVYEVNNKAWLNEFAAGDKVFFIAKKINGMFVITKIQK
jgi:Cu/Ag efflux protein CusF